MLIWGPFPHTGGVFGGGIGGYARCNSQMLRSRLARAVDLRRLPMTVPRFHNRLLAAIYLIPRMVADCISLLYELVANRPDVLHITALYWRSIHREAYAVLLARSLGIQVVYDVRAGTFIDFASSRTTLGSLPLRIVMGLANEITVEGRAYVDYIERRFGRQATWVPNFVLDGDLKEYPPAQLEEPQEGQPFRIAFTGYLIPDKGVDVLLRSAHSLSERCPVEVTLIGEHSSRIRRELERYTGLQSDRFQVRAPGRLEFSDVLEELQRQHVFVFLSRFYGEGHSNAVSEAMAMGLPVIVSRHGFLADVVTDSCGVVVDDPTDADRVTEELWKLRNDWQRLVRLGRGARERIHRRFGETPVLSRTEAIYERCRGRAT